MDHSDRYTREVLKTLQDGLAFTMVATASGAKIGLHFGPQGAAVGAATGATIGLGATIYAVIKLSKDDPASPAQA